MDGIDAVLARIDEDDIEVRNARKYAWPRDVAATLRKAASNEAIQPSELGHIDALVGEHFAAAALNLLGSSGVVPEKIRAIGSHGQTIFHAPDSAVPFSMQIGDPNRIAHRTGITTVADFRRRDMAAGGQGAPLVPAFHEAVFGALGKIAVLNIGGIANLTFLSGSPLESTFGYDTGPGNCLMDAWIRRHQDKPFDKNGAWAATGTVNTAILNRLLTDPYFVKLAPKSTGPEHFSLPWLDQTLAQFPPISPADVQATLLQLSVQTVADALRRSSTAVARILVCGGGVHNSQLIRRLGALVAPRPIESTATHGLDPDWVEATAFAWLARQTLDGRPGNLPAVTGASSPVLLGGIYRA